MDPTRPGLSDALRGFLGSRRWLVVLLYPALLAVVRKFGIPLTEEDLAHVFYLCLAIITGESVADVAARWKGKLVEPPTAPPAAPPSAGPGAGTAAALLLLLGGGLALSGCGLLGGTKENELAVRAAVTRLDQGLELQREVTAANVDALCDELLARSLAEVDQAVLDDQGRLAAAGKLSREDLDKLEAAAAEKRQKAVEAVTAMRSAMRDPRVARDVRELYSRVRAYFLARLDTDAAVADLEDQVRRLAESAGLEPPKGKDPGR